MVCIEVLPLAVEYFGRLMGWLYGGTFVNFSRAILDLLPGYSRTSIPVQNVYLQLIKFLWNAFVCQELEHRSSISRNGVGEQACQQVTNCNLNRGVIKTPLIILVSEHIHQISLAIFLTCL